MLEFAQHFEQMSVWFSPVVLIGPGLMGVLLGLFVWLGGLGFRKVLFAVAGAVSGGICGFFIIGQNIILVMVSAGLAVAFAIMFEKLFIIILTAVIAAVLGFAVLAKSYIEEAEGLKQHPEYKTQNVGESLSIRQTVEITKAYIGDFSTGIKEAGLEMSLYSWAIIVALVVIFMAAGFFFWRLTSAFCYAALGTMLIFAGMILLLLYKGAAPISSICRKQSFYLSAFTAMTVFGTIEQLLLCQRVREKLTTKKGTEKETKKDKQKTDERMPSWRTT